MHRFDYYDSSGNHDGEGCEVNGDMCNPDKCQDWEENK